METNISAHTLFHFTYNKNSLLSILKNGLYVRYSLENFESLINDKAEIVFPMTCFCDIPLSHVRRHTNTYGKYAIGVSKSWGMKNQINPIIYTYPNSATTTILNDVFENIFSSGATLSIEFIITAIVLWLAENAKRTNKSKGIDDTTYIDAGLIGVAQGIAILPGISRSGFTLACSLLRGLDREFAIRFSFLLSIPAILGAAAFDCYKILKTGYSFTANIEIWPFIAGIITAALAGCIAIKFMLKKISKLNLKMFSYYLFALSAFILVDQLFFGKFFEKIIF